MTGILEIMTLSKWDWVSSVFVDSGHVSKSLAQIFNDNGYLLVFSGLPIQYTVKYMLSLALLLFGGMASLKWRAHRRIRNRGLWPADIAFASFLCLSLFLLLEGVCVAFFDISDSFSLSKFGRLWYARHVQLNNMGFRDDRNYTSKPESHTQRICFIGDSFTFGHGIRRIENRFTSIIDQQLSERSDHHFEICNLALPGWNTGEQRDRLADMVKDGFRADIFILMYVLNDTTDLQAENVLFNQHMKQLEPDNLFLRKSFVLDFLYYRWFVQQLPEVQNYFSWIREGYEPPIWEQQCMRLRELRQICESSGARFGVVIFPFLHNLGDDPGDAKIHAQLRHFWESEGVPVLDLLDDFKQESSPSMVVNRFDAHPNERAHQLAAEIIANEMLSTVFHVISAF
ncbi:MAG: SGNH/GDSL hydrolase family protein [Planctomycetota bacterium]|nr:SGNH/GDSL hydrolase family protein [Planctomycetota bacterium]